MARREGPSLRALWLGQRLRKLREEHRYTLDYLADYLECSASSLSRVETALFPIKRIALQALFELYNITDKKTREDLLMLREEAWRKGWWDGYQDAYYDEGFIDYPWLESRASRIKSYEAIVVPGLFQTAEYAEATIRDFEGTAPTDEQVARWVELRAERQRILTKEDPPAISMVVDESTLRRPIGGWNVLRGQLKKLLELGRLANVDIRLLPLATESHPGTGGAFTIFDLPDPYPDVAHVESLAGRLFAEDLTQVDRFNRVYAALHEAALTPAETAKSIRSILEEIPT